MPIEKKLEKKKKLLSNLIQTNIQLSDKNWFHTGGPATFYAEPTNALEFQQALTFAQQNKQTLFLLGEGANILISDEGFKGLVIKPQLTTINRIPLDTSNTNVLVRVDAGVTMQGLIDYCLDHTIVGLEEFSGIPGTIGGAVFINLHYFEFLLGNFLVSAQVIDKKTCNLHTVDNAWFNFGYNKSKLHDKQHYLVSATFKLKKTTDIETAYAKGRSTEIKRHRAKRYPSTHTCGSFFRNFFDDEIKLEINGKKMIFIAYYLDKIGVKGNLSVGNAMVSYQHANMIVNTGNAMSTDIITLAKKMQQLVKKEFGIIPQPECRLVGFKKYPLLQK